MSTSTLNTDSFNYYNQITMDKPSLYCLLILAIAVLFLSYFHIVQYQANTNDTLFKICQTPQSEQSLDLSQTTSYQYNRSCHNLMLQRLSQINSLNYSFFQNSGLKNQCISLSQQYDILVEINDINKIERYRKMQTIIRKALNKLFCDYDSEQDKIFIELQIISKMILKNDYLEEVYKDRNILHYKMTDLLNKNTNTNFSKEHNYKSQVNFKVLSNILNKLQFKRFLRVDIKFDRFEFMINYLNKQHYSYHPLALATINLAEKKHSRVNSAQKFNTIYYVSKEDLYYFNTDPNNFFYNLEETMRRVIDEKSVDFNFNFVMTSLERMTENQK